MDPGEPDANPRNPERPDANGGNGPAGPDGLPMIAAMDLDEPAARRLRFPIEPGRAGAGVDLAIDVDALLAAAGPVRSAALLADGGRAGTAVWRLSEELGLVLAVDGFPPPLPDPTLSGQITAVHVLGQVFATGAAPAFALATLGLSPHTPAAILRPFLRGAERTLADAEAALAGGRVHRAAEPIVGLAVVGSLDPSDRLRPDGARPGDRLVLTKPLGTGLVLAGQDRRGMRESWLAAAIEAMTRLDGPVPLLARRHRLGGAVHVGGAGLLGAAASLARGAGCRIVLEARELPALPGALELAAAGVEDEGATRVRDAVAPLLTLDLRLDPLLVALAADPQTAGGLLLAVPPTRLEPVLRDLIAAGVRGWVVGRVEAAARPEIVLG